MNFQIGQLYKTGEVVLEIKSIVPVTRWFSKLEMKIHNSGMLLDWTIDCGSDEFEKAIGCGLVTPLLSE